MYNEKQRLLDLKSYQILDTPPEKILDEIAKIASLVCDVPISLITFLDEDRQWFKAKIGLEVPQTKKEDSFCQHALQEPKEVLIVNDSLTDDRFANSPLVTGSPYIRFYAGAPLETPDGNVLGTLCVIDRKPREITENQKKALQLLAKQAMDYLNTRKVVLAQKDKIETDTNKLKKITDNVPGGIFQLKATMEGELFFEFLSSGIKEIISDVDFAESKTSLDAFFNQIHSDDLQSFKENLNNSIKNSTELRKEYRVKSGEDYRWHLVTAKPEKLTDGSTVLYGSFQDITHHVEYEKAMEEIAFDISHVLRRPVATLLGLTDLISSEKKITKNELLKYVGYINTVSRELEEFTVKLNQAYHIKKEKIIGKNKKHKN